MRKLLLMSCVMAFSSPAFAQTIDAKGADQLANTLSKYFGKTALKKGILKVTPDADAYRITFSTDAFLKSMPKQDYFKGNFGDYSILTKPLADGTWNVTSAAMPAGSFEVNGPKGPESFQWSIGNGNWTGVFDPKIGTFAKSNFSYDSFKLTATTPEQDIDASATESKGEMIASAAATGGIDLNMTQTAKNFSETISTKLPTAETAPEDESATPNPLATGEPIKIVVRGGEVGTTAESKGFRNNEFMDLWTFFIAHSDEKKLKKPEQVELKKKLSALLPLWEKLKGEYHFKDFAVETPMGNFAAQNISQDMTFDGISKNGAYHYAVRTNGLKYPPLPIPEWGVPFLPTDVELTIGTTGVDLDTVVKGAIEDMDLEREKVLSEEFETRTAAQFLMAPPKLVISKSLVRTADAELTVEGEVTFTGLKPESHTTWEMAGFDKVVERLNKAAETDEDIKNSIVFVKLAKDFGTPIDGGKIQWIVDQKADGSVAINGNPVKGPDPVVEPGSDDAIDSTAPEGEDEDPDAGADTAQ
ncbi:hypothetical protein [Phyllobacterium myrsinacearum]|uniref:DUF2125 domain-containing protein n=1 Tax=Phyllobacterium myrsinacearum TaxID=28101 RepID=A0A839EN22_9HYPH|nr:hypothetical protein [Phyllobacterium myrsinacearum]MBA8880239.1 hypothetical protein [Phyllobacterium myrsinacearum]